MAGNILETLTNEERRRFIAAHAPDILCALIVRRTGTEPKNLVGPAIEAAMMLFNEINQPHERADGTR